MKYIGIIFVIFILFTACEQEEVKTYSENVTGIFFQQLASYTPEGTPISYSDSLVVSFANASKKVKANTYRMPVLITGKEVPYPRKVKVVVDEELTTAIRGKHFEINTDTIYLPADTCRCFVPVTLLRHPDLLKNTYTVALRLEENENFKIMVNAYKNLHSWTATGVNLDATRFRIIFSEKYTQPGYWKNMDTFGDYSVAKYLFVNQLMGWTAADWRDAGYGGAKIGSGKAVFVANLMQKELQKRADAGDPLIDENGKYVQLPSPYEVDYSRYEK